MLRASCSGSCFADSGALPVLMQKASQRSLCFTCPSLSQPACEKEKNTFSSSSLQAPAMKVGLALECGSPSSKPFKHAINPSPFRKVQTQLHFAKRDLGAHAN